MKQKQPKAEDCIIAIQKKANSKKASIYRSFFKTGKGEYGEGDVFAGVVVPECRKIAKQFFGLSLFEIKKLLSHRIHEVRLVALVVLVHQYSHAHVSQRERMYQFYLTHRKHINNWDLVDVSAHHIVGAHLTSSSKEIIFKLASSEILWDKRIAIVSTLYDIKWGKFETILLLTKRLLKDKHDLIHKALGWMLREVGKKDIKVLTDFLEIYKSRLPRTTLRYAIEKMDAKSRKRFLNT